MAYQSFPTWLSSFSISVLDQNNIPLFDQYENELEDIEFLDGVGCVVDSIIEIKNIKYKVDEFKFHFGKDRRSGKVSSQLQIIVSVTND